jgi:hypothetical protein
MDAWKNYVRGHNNNNNNEKKKKKKKYKTFIMGDSLHGPQIVTTEYLQHL